MFKLFILVCFMAFGAASPSPKADPGLLAAYTAPVAAAYTAPVAYSAAYTAPLAYSAAYTAPLAYSAAYTAPVAAYSAYPYASPYAAYYLR